MRGSGALGLLTFPLLLVTQLVAVAVSQAATITGVSELYLGRSVTIGAAFQSARGRIVGILIASCLVGLLTFLGLLLLIVPGVLLALRWSLTVPALVIEDLSPRDAMARSSDLTEGHRGRVFAVESRKPGIFGHHFPSPLTVG